MCHQQLHGIRAVLLCLCFASGVTGPTVESGPEERFYDGDARIIDWTAGEARVPPRGDAAVQRDAVSIHTAHGTPDSERASLMDLYGSTGGARWLRNDNWGTGYPCNGSWFGVACMAGTVRLLSLNLNNLEGTVPDAVCDLADLMALRLSGNTISGTVPRCLGNLTRLMELQMGSMVGGGLTGALPEELGNLNGLQAISLEGNKLTGRVPCSFGGMIGLRIVRLFDNVLEGPLDDCLQGMGSASGGTMNFFIAHNEFTGVVPTMWPHLARLSAYSNRFTHLHPLTANSTSLINLLLEYNLLAGTVPSELRHLSSGMVKLHLDNNALDGTISEWICGMHALQDFTASMNQLRGTIPECVGEMTSLRMLNLDSNMLSGTIPRSFANSTVSDLILSNNSLVGNIPDFTTHSPLYSLDVSHNRLAADFPSVCSRLWRTSVEKVDISSCGLTGNIGPDFMVAEDPGQPGKIQVYLKHLRRFSASGNGLPGELKVIAYMTSLENLTDVNFEDNRLAGEIPDNFVHFAVLLLSGNPDLAGDRLPPFLTLGGTSTVRKNGTAACPQIVNARQGKTVTLDPSYLGYRHCSCRYGYHGQGGHCSQCPENALCSGGDSLQPDYGFFKEVNGDTGRIGFVKCVDPQYRFTACTPDGCLPGYEGRLCFACARDYFDSSKRCIKCGPVETALLLTLTVLLCVVLSAVFIARTFLTKIDVGLRTLVILLKNFAFFIQTFCYMIVGLTLHWPPGLLTTARILNWPSGSGNGISCWILLNVAENVSFWVVSAIVLIVMKSFVALCLIRAALSRNFTVRDEFKLLMGIEKGEKTLWLPVTTWIRIVDALRFYFLSVAIYLYLPVVFRFMSQLTCTWDHVLGERYLASLPHIRCETGTDWHAKFLFTAIVGVPFVAVGMPLMVFVVIRKDRARPKDEPVGDDDDEGPYRNDNQDVYEIIRRGRTYAASLELPYRNGMPYWELVNMFFRFCEAVAFTVLVESTQALMLGMCLIYVSRIYLHTHFMPFEKSRHNCIMTWSMVVIIGDFVIGLAHSMMPYFGSFDVVGHVMTVVTWATIALFLLMFIGEVGPVKRMITVWIVSARNRWEVSDETASEAGGVAEKESSAETGDSVEMESVGPTDGK